METWPAVFISRHKSVLKPVCNYYHGVIVFIELEIKTSPGDKMSVSFMLAHIYQFTVIESRPIVDFGDWIMASIVVLMLHTHTHLPARHRLFITLGVNVIIWGLNEIPPSFTATYIYAFILFLVFPIHGILDNSMKTKNEMIFTCKYFNICQFISNLNCLRTPCGQNQRNNAL